MNVTNIHYGNILSSFNIEWDTYGEFKKDDDPNVRVINDKENECKVIKWVSTFTDFFSQIYGYRGSLAYVLQNCQGISRHKDGRG